MSKVHILLFMPTSSLTGGPRVLLNLLGQLDRNRFEPLVILLQEGPLVNELRERGVRFRVMRLDAPVKLEAVRRAGLVSRLGILRAWYGFNAKLQSTMSEAGVDIVWARNLKGVLLVGLGARRLGRCLIWDVGLEKPASGWFRWLNLLGLLIANRVVTEAPRQPAQIFGEGTAGRFAGKIRTIDPGISEERVEEIRAATANGPETVLKRNADLNVLQVGTLCPRKNQLLAIQAVERLKAHSICLHLVGAAEDQSYRRRIEGYIRDHALEDKVVVYGWSNRIPEFLAAADLLLMTSLNEGIPYAVHEAMHARRPVIVSDAGGMADAVVPEVTGKIVRAGSLSDLIDALEDFIEDPGLLQSMGNAASRHVTEKFSARRWYERYQCLFCECLDRLAEP